MIRVLVILGTLAALAGVAHAYPQFQLARDVTCTGCHVSPDGTGILSENGVTTAEAIAWKPGDGNWMYGVHKPEWLQLGGDLRGAAGYFNNGLSQPAGFPMQAEVAANAVYKGFSLNVIGGLRDPQQGGSALHVLWSRQHYLMWQQKPGETTGLFVRVGRMMPTFGLRLAEHIVYTQRYGGRPLYGEAYAAAVSYVDPSFEVHATAFTHDPIASAVEHGDGGALYAEKRLGAHAAMGIEGKYSTSDDLHRTFGGVTGKLHLPGPDLLFQAEAEVVREKIAAVTDDARTQLIGYLMATKPLPKGLMLDVGLGHFTEDTRVKGLFKDCLDVNLHWFTTSHIELLLTTRVEAADLWKSESSGYALAQLHYRL